MALEETKLTKSTVSPGLGDAVAVVLDLVTALWFIVKVLGDATIVPISVPPNIEAVWPVVTS